MKSRYATFLVLLLLAASGLVWMSSWLRSRSKDLQQSRGRLSRQEETQEDPLTGWQPSTASGRSPQADSIASGQSSGAPPTNRAAEVSTETADEEFLLVFFSEADTLAFVQRLQARGGTLAGRIDRLNAVRIRVPSEAWLQELLAETGLPVSRERNIQITVPPAPFPETEPGTPPTGGYVGFGDNAARWLGAPDVAATWGQGVVVAVLDSGISDHPSLSTSVRHLNASEGDTAHGTAIASIIAGNGNGIQGLAPAVTLLDIPILDASGKGDQFVMAEAIVRAVDEGASIINISAGGRPGSHVLETAIEYAANHGVVVVASAGNEGVDGLAYPAAFRQTVAVGAVDATGRPVYFSNRGDPLDLAAPGIAVEAALPDEGETYVSGTSGSAAWVSGALAVLMSEKGLSAQDAAELLEAYANDTGEPGSDPLSGKGILDVGRSLEHDTPGIVDAAVLNPDIGEDAQGNVRIVVGVQNRGTETLGQVVLRVDVNGAVESPIFYDLEVGESAGHTVRLPAEALLGPISVQCRAVIRGAEDMRPGNDAFSIEYEGPQETAQ